MQKKNQGQTAPLKKRKHGWRHLLRERTWAALNIIVGVSMLANTSSFVALIPDQALAAGQPPQADLDQCANGPVATPVDCTGAAWQNGNLNENQAHYVEGESASYRAKLTNLPTGTPITITLGYDVKHSDKHAVDYITHYDRTDVNVDPTNGVAGVAGSPNTFAIPTPPSYNTPVAGQPVDSFNALPANERLLSIWNGTISSVNYVNNADGNLGDLAAAQSETRFEVTFTATNETVVLAWGGHIGSRLDWGYTSSVPNSAGGISGSPYHMRLVGWTLGNLGNTDRSLSAGAIAPPGNVVIEKQTVPDGSSQTFSFTSATASLAGTLGDGDQTLASLAAGQYTVTEDTSTTGWTLTSISCDDTDSTGNISTGVLTLNVASQENVKCVFTNSQHPKLTVTKVVNNNDGGTAVVGDFDLFVDQNQVTSGQSNTMAPGSYVVSEDNLPGYNGVISGDCDANGNVSLAYGDDKACTITNSDIAPTLKLVKNLTTNSGGSSTLADWTLTATGTNGFSYTADQSSFETVKANIAYTLSESGPDGYQAGSWSCDGGTLVGNEVTLALDTDVTCQITNDDLAPTLKLVKNVSGGTNVSSEWTMTATGNGGFSDDGDSVIFHEVLANVTYTLSENGPAGYTAGNWSCDGGTLVGNEVTLALDEDVTCEVTNERDRGTVELQKEWSGIPGSTTLTITDSQQQVVDMQAVLGANDSTGKTPVDTGTFYMSETGGLSDYTASNLVCYDDANGNSQNDNENAVSVGANDSVNVGKDQNVVCSYTNTRNTGTVTIYKVVRGGTADSSDWTFTLHGQNGLPDVTGIKHGVPVTGVPTGFYTVSESGPAQYSFVGVYGDCSEDGSIYMDVDQDGSTCTFVNETYGIHGQKFNDVNANATWDAGEVALNGWTMFLDANLNKSLDSGEKSIVTQNHNSVDGWYWFDDLAAGSYQICEVQQAGWAQTYPVTASGCHTIELPISYEFNREGPPIIKNSSCKLSLDQSFSVMAVENSIVSEASCDFGNRLIPVTTIALDKTGPATATPGQTFTYTLEWKVNGNTAATNAVITDPLPANTTFVSQTCGTTTPTCTPSFTGNTAKWELGTRAVGTSGTVTVTVLVNPSLSASTTLNNTGTFDTDQTPPVNDSVPTTVTVPQVLGISTELGLTKSVSTPSAAPGDIVTYTLVVTNEGLGDATNVVVTDNLPDGFVFLATNKATRTWNLGTLAAGESKTLTYKVLVTPNVVAGPYVNRAFVTADFFDPLAAEALVTVKIPQVLGLATTGAGLMDYVTFVLGLALVASGVISFLKLRRRGTRTA